MHGVVAILWWETILWWENVAEWTPQDSDSFYLVDSDILSQCCMWQWGPSVPWHMVHLNNNDMIWDMIWYYVNTIWALVQLSEIATVSRALMLVQNDVYTSISLHETFIPKNLYRYAKNIKVNVIKYAMYIHSQHSSWWMLYTVFKQTAGYYFCSIRHAQLPDLSCDSRVSVIIHK